LLKAKAKALTFKVKAKAKDSKFVLEDTPRTKAKNNNTAKQFNLVPVSPLGRKQAHRTIHWPCIRGLAV